MHACAAWQLGLPAVVYSWRSAGAADVAELLMLLLLHTAVPPVPLFYLLSDASPAIRRCTFRRPNSATLCVAYPSGERHMHTLVLER